MRLPRLTRTQLIAVVVVAVATALAIASSWTDAPIVDEVPHIGAGYSYLTQLDYRLNPEHPPLAKDLAAIPLLFVGLNDFVFTTPPWMTETNGQWQFGRTVIFYSGVSADTVKNLARLPVLLVFFVSGAYFIWRWSQERYGDTAAIIATTLWSFSPTVLAHGRLVTTDAAAAWGVLVATYFFLRFLRNPSKASFIWSALTLGLALLTKFNVVLLGPYFVIIALLSGLDGNAGKRARHRAWKNFLATAAIGIAAFVGIVWPVYIAHTWNYPLERQVRDTRSIVGTNPALLESIALWASDKPVIRAAGHWVLGLAMVAQRSAGGNTIYWLGRIVKEGGPWYFPIVYFLKEPLAWWVLAAMALTALVFHRKRHRGEPTTGSWWSRHLDEWVWLLWLAIYWVVSIHSTLNIGIRHLMPIYPFTIMLVAGRLSVLTDWLHHHDKPRMKVFSTAIAILLGWYVFESVHVFPYYLTYFNQVAGGPAGGYRYVTDSNLDWGQDIRRLGVWLQEQNVAKVSLDYFGWSDPSYYLDGRYVYTTATQFKGEDDFIRRNQSNGWIAISGTYLQQATYTTDPVGDYRWLLGHEPVIVVGNSIFVFHITK